MSGTRSGKGVELNLIDTASRWGSGTFLLLVNTHLDPEHLPTSQQNMRQQILEVRNVTKKKKRKRKSFFFSENTKWKVKKKSRKERKER